MMNPRKKTFGGPGSVASVCVVPELGREHYYEISVGLCDIVSKAELRHRQSKWWNGVAELLLWTLTECQRLPIDMAVEILRQIVGREDLGSTGIGRNWATPHLAHQGVPNSQLTIVQLSGMDVEWDSLDGEPVSMFACYTAPGVQKYRIWNALTRALGEAYVGPTSSVEELTNWATLAFQVAGGLSEADVLLRTARENSGAKEFSQFACSLGRLGDDSIGKLVGALHDKSVDKRHTAACILGSIGMEAGNVIPHLASALEDNEVLVRRAAAKALETIMPIEPTTTIPHFVAALRDEDSWVRHAAVDALASAGAASVQAIQPLADVLVDVDVLVRRASARALGSIGPSAALAVPRLADALSDDDEYVCRAAATAIGAIGPSAAEFATPRLVDALAAEDDWLRHDAAVALGKFGAAGVTAISCLTLALRDPEANVRKAAVEALVSVGGSEQLEEALLYVEEDVRNWAYESLGSVEE